MRRVVAVAATIPTLLLGGCLAEDSLDMAVYFDNKTDVRLYLSRRDLVKNGDHETILPNGVTSLMLLGKGDCSRQWVIIDRDGTTVKDPGRICWHDTVSIP